ncbi:MAG TPA: hypothetical protein PKC69_00520 [Chitinophagaceae bacterium]|nr:hypothetical protein [Chitinophagaceae bacterium]
MKTTALLFPIFVYTTMVAMAQPKAGLKQVMELQMPTNTREMQGKNGACVAWHPEQKKYYAAFAGNSAFPLAIFDAKGARLSDDDMKCRIDVRGLWYSPVKKQIWGNGYYQNGWFSYKLTKDGLVQGITNEIEGEESQPEDNAIGVYNTASNRVLFLSYDAKVHSYNEKGKPRETIDIHWGRTREMGTDRDSYPDILQDYYNYYSLAYTGNKGQELGFLNVKEKQVELYDIKTGFLTKILTLPATAPVQEEYNFAYANGIYWLFDKENRRWLGYK